MGSIIGGSNKSNSVSQSSGYGVSSGIQGSNSSSQGTSNSQGTSFNFGNSTSQGTSNSSGVSTSRGTSTSKQRAGLTAEEVLSNWNTNKNGTDQWSKSSALGDVSGVLRQQATDALQQVMPSIAKTETGRGAYNSTTKELLHNDANARITGQLSKTALDAITQYGQLGNQTNQNNNQLLSSLASTASATGSSDANSLNSADSQQLAVSQQTADSFTRGGSQQTANSQQTSDSSSFGATESEQAQSSGSASNSSGGTGLVGIVTTLAPAISNSAVGKLAGKLDPLGGAKGLNDVFSGFSPAGGYTPPIPAPTTSKPTTVKVEEPAKKLTFADGGQVANMSKKDFLQSFMDMSGMSNGKMDFEDMMKGAKKISAGDIRGGSEAFLTEQEKNEMKMIETGYNALSSMFGEDKALKRYADGGMVDFQDIQPFKFEDILDFKADPEAKSSSGKMSDSSGSSDMQDLSDIMSIASLFFADGGKVSSKNNLLAQMQKYAMGGKVRSGEADVQTGGKIRGKQSPEGKDNQVIGVAGGEGIIPKDVMDVPGVSEWLDKMIEQYHTPVKSGQGG